MPVEIRVPEMGESVVDATVGKWLKKEGDPVKIGEAVVGLETDKVNVEVTADQSGVVSKILHKEGDTVGVGDVLAIIAEGAAAAPAAGAPAAAAAPAASAISAPATPAAQTANGGAPATPVAARVAAAAGVDVAAVPGTGRGGRVTADDVKEFVSKPATTEAPAAPAPAPAARPAAAGVDSRHGLGVPTNRPLDPRGEERIAMPRLRQTIARRLFDAKHDAAMLTTFNEIDMTAVMDLRRRRQEEFQKRNNVRLGFMSFFTKAVIGALKFQPYLNAELDGTDIILKKYFDIGMAVGTPRGLVVPVVRDADKMTFADIERTIGELAVKARDGKLTLDDLRGGSFTITNGGVFGSLQSTPILNPPQVGILGLHKIEERPVVIGGEIKVRNMMYVAVSYDHRIVDGEQSVRFLVRIKELMEDPEQLLLEG